MQKNKIYKRIAAAMAGMLMIISVQAQNDTMYVGNEDSLYLSNDKDTMGVFGNVIHNGVWGTTTGSYAYFMGGIWKNTATAKFPMMNSGTTDGGIFCITAQPLVTAYSQIIRGGYSRRILAGPVFPNVVIANGKNVYLDSTDMAVYNKVKMDTGLVYMSANAGGLDNTENCFVLGGGSLKPSVINYNRNKYFVSGVLPTDTSYFYVRNVVSGDTAVFPVGSKIKDYTPAGVSAISGDIMARAFDGVYQNGNTGSLITDASYIQKTWQVVTPLAPADSYNLILQNHLFNETTTYSNTRDQSYISRYNGAGGWDIIPPNQPAYTDASLYPNIGNDGDSVFYHWRILSQIVGSNTAGAYYTKRIINSSLLSVEKSLVGIEPVLMDSVYNIMFKIVVTNKNTTTLNNLSISDNLNNTFGFPSVFKLSSVNIANGYLKANSSYSGTGADTLLVSNGSLEANMSDTIYVLVRFTLNGTSVFTYTNTTYGGLNNTAGQLYDILDSSSVTFNITPLNVFIPDGFSPNGDGINDTYVIGHTSQQTIDLAVFNRWGNKVFSEDNYKNEWDGKGKDNFLGKDVEEGTYYVLVTIHDKQKGVYKVVKFITIRRDY